MTQPLAMPVTAPPTAPLRGRDFFQYAQPFPLPEAFVLPAAGPDGKDTLVTGGRARVYWLLRITAEKGYRHAIGTQTGPPGWVPRFLFVEPWCGGQAGDRRLRDLRTYGCEYEHREFGQSSTTLYRLTRDAVQDGAVDGGAGGGMGGDGEVGILRFAQDDNRGGVLENPHAAEGPGRARPQRPNAGGSASSRHPERSEGSRRPSQGTPSAASAPDLAALAFYTHFDPFPCLSPSGLDQNRSNPITVPVAQFWAAGNVRQLVIDVTPGADFCLAPSFRLARRAPFDSPESLDSAYRIELAAAWNQGDFAEVLRLVDDVTAIHTTNGQGHKPAVFFAARPISTGGWNPLPMLTYALTKGGATHLATPPAPATAAAEGEA